MYYENEFYLFYFVRVWSIHVCVSVETRDQRWMSSYSIVLSWNLELRLCWPGWPGSYLTRAGVTDMLYALSVYEAAAGGSKLKFSCYLANTLSTEPPPQPSLYFNVAVGISLSPALAFFILRWGSLSTGQSGLHLVSSHNHLSAGITGIQHHGWLLLYNSKRHLGLTAFCGQHCKEENTRFCEYTSTNPHRPWSREL